MPNTLNGAAAPIGVTEVNPSAKIRQPVDFDHDYYAVSFQTIASLASRCLDEQGSDGHDILFAIQKMAEGLAKELDAFAAITAGDMEGNAQ